MLIELLQNHIPIYLQSFIQTVIQVSVVKIKLTKHSGSVSLTEFLFIRFQTYDRFWTTSPEQ